MGKLLICDLCEQPIQSFAQDMYNGDKYAIRRRGFHLWSGWTYLDAHDGCVRKLLKGTK